MRINLDTIVCSNFRVVFNDIIKCNIYKAILKGGRSSTKSQVASLAIVVGSMVYKESAVACIRYANKIQDRLVNTFTDSIRYLGVDRFWRLRKSPLEYVLLDANGNETDVSIKFTGCDNPETLKSMRSRRGGFRYIWFEETSNFDSEKDVDNLILTLARGLGKHCIIFSYNPPMHKNNWLNKRYGDKIGLYRNKIRVDIGCGNEIEMEQLVHHSTYLDVIEDGHYDWIGSTFIAEANQAKIENNIYYRWAYGGEVVQTEAAVFNNIKEWKYEELQFNTIYRGLDYGNGGPDPHAYVEWYYDKQNRRIYAINEVYEGKAVNYDELAEKIKKYNKHNFPIYADSANKHVNALIRKWGVNTVDVIKGPGSVLSGILFLQSLNGIYIDRKKTPNIYREFTNLDYKTDKNDEITSEIEDKDNHTVDATRYAFSMEIRNNI